MSLTTHLPAAQVRLPLLPLRDVVMFPQMVIPLFVGRYKSVRALDMALNSTGPEDRLIALFTQKKQDFDGELGMPHLYTDGCVGRVLQVLKMPDGTSKVLVEGLQRAKLQDVTLQSRHEGQAGGSSAEGSLYVCDVLPCEPYVPPTPDRPLSARLTKVYETLRRAVIQRFEQYTQQSRQVPPEIMASISALEDLSRLADTVVSHVPFKVEDKQKILALAPLEARLKAVVTLFERELEIFNLDKKLKSEVKKTIEKNQREYYLREQAQQIQKELSDGEDGLDLEALEKKIRALKMPKAAQDKALKETKKLRAMSPMSAEAAVIRTYVDVLTGLPWTKKTKLKNDLAYADQVLSADHYGLDKVKQRILEFLAVQARVGKLKGPILCLVGPPGVGKTSLGQSIAKATGRKYVRMALGGVHDEAEIRGHRRTYIGALPGKILQNLSKVQVRNPLFLLDEIDKMGADHRGDPSSALLEVLDPEQNHAFGDHYVDIDFDLSDVLFVATSNTLNIPPALLDRMEVIRLSGYTEDEKRNIATHHLLPKQISANGLKPEELVLEEAAVLEMIRYYTREAGVRNLEREIAKICRKVVKGLQLEQFGKGVTSIAVTPQNLSDFLGVRKYTYGQMDEKNQVGQVTGLAWTEMGGDLLTIESATMPGKGNIIRTGSLGHVMKESVEAARTVVRARAALWGIANEVFEKRDLHIHVPDGATPKDGPSAGAAMTTAMVSALTGIAVRRDVAMTGEITLRGEVTQIGGLKEKLLAARRGGIRTVLIPQDNIKDLAEIPDNVKAALQIVPVRWIDRVLELALERMPTPLEPTLLHAPAKEATAQPQPALSLATLDPSLMPMKRSGSGTQALPVRFAYL